MKNETTSDKPVLPILFLHGWPGSVREFYEIVTLLTAPQKDLNVSFAVVVASLPGFAFSDPARLTDLGSAEAAVIFRNLMLRIGYNKFMVQGGDFGSFIGSNMATLFPENVIAYHSNFCLASLSNIPNLLKFVAAMIFPSLFVPENYTDPISPIGDQLNRIGLCSFASNETRHNRNCVVT